MAVALKGGARSTSETPLPAYFHRLSLRAQRIFLRSNEIPHFDFAPNRAAIERTNGLLLALESGAPTIVERAAQSLIAELCRCFALAAVTVQVRSVRPHNTRGELHGIFYPRGNGRPAANPYQFSAAVSNRPLIILWMRTAQRHDVVKPRTFFRTLMHEFAHYLDYALLQLGDSPHTPGFFKRESFLVRSLSAAQLPIDG